MDKGELRKHANSVLSGINDSTAAEYERVAARLNGKHWRDYASERGLARRSAAVLRAGWRHARAREVLDGLRESDRAARSGDRETVRQARQAAEHAAAALDQDATAPHYEPPPQEQRGAGSKRRSLPRTHGWDHQVYGQLRSREDRLRTLVLGVTGCRPSELDKGVSLSIDQDGHLVARIGGSKVSDNTGGGQQWRELTLPAEGDHARKLSSWVRKQGGKVTVSGCTEAYRKRLARAGERAGWRGISPYSFRHQFASDEKAESNDDELSAALGHASARSRQHYGHARQARGKGGVRARAAEPVRSPEPTPASGPSLG